jgi:hypothetical protein
MQTQRANRGRASSAGVQMAAAGIAGAKDQLALQRSSPC